MTGGNQSWSSLSSLLGLDVGGPLILFWPRGPERMPPVRASGVDNILSLLEERW